MSSDFLGSGFKLPLGFSSGRIELAQDEDCIRQSIWMILGTAPGERLMRPDFGCGIHNLVFAATNATTIGRIKDEVQQALLNWEPRIDVLDVQTTVDRDSPNRLLIQINYRVRTTNNRFNLVYPFYLN
ncbi:GPW/gp25 family protein [Leptolyngbya sp. AN03gr2]|uniref:GPW/gp25 family protein n=1 Tax=unclassified Leptolyngbya TaxID=2650499 RepID=UPI003D31BD4E